MDWWSGVGPLRYQELDERVNLVRLVWEQHEGEQARHDHLEGHARNPNQQSQLKHFESVAMVAQYSIKQTGAPNVP